MLRMIAHHVKEAQVERVYLILQTVNILRFHGVFFARLFMTLFRMGLKIKSGRKLEKTAVSVVGQPISHF